MQDHNGGNSCCNTEQRFKHSVPPPVMRKVPEGRLDSFRSSWRAHWRVSPGEGVVEWKPDRNTVDELLTAQKPESTQAGRVSDESYRAVARHRGRSRRDGRSLREEPSVSLQAEEVATVGYTKGVKLPRSAKSPNSSDKRRIPARAKTNSALRHQLLHVVG